MFWTIVLSILCLIFAFQIWVTSRRLRNGSRLPPGPSGLPVLGFLHYFAYGRHYNRILASMKEKYGQMCTVRMGSFDCLWLNDAALVHEAWANPAFCARPRIHGIESRAPPGVRRGGLIFTDETEAEFVEQRRFTLRTLRGLGFGRGRGLMEQYIQEEAAELVAGLRRLGGAPTSTRHRFNVASVNALWRIVTGEKLDRVAGSEVVQELVEALDRNMELTPGVKLAFFIPWLAKLCPNLIGWAQYVRDANGIFDFWRRYAEKRLEEPRRAEEDSNFIDLFIQETKSTKMTKKVTDSLALVLQDLFIAGTETTATTLCWALLYLAAYPGVQKRVYAEIRSALGSYAHAHAQAPCLVDRPKMIYTQAFIHETLRHATLAPLGMLHSTLEPVHFHGWLIPPGTIVQANICGAHRDPEYWGCDPHPDIFEPERFLVTSTPGGETSLNLKAGGAGFLAFSHGKRACPGEALARDELFLFVSSIVQEFQIDLDEHGKSSGFDLEPLIGVSAIPKPHKLKFIQRK